MPTTSGPLILLSPAKSLSFDGTMAKALAAVTPTMPKFLSKSTELTSSLAKLSKKDIKTLMSLSDSLAELNHGRFQSFDEQPTRIAIGAFQGQAYQGLDAASLSSAELDYCQGHLRILCGLYGILLPYDALRPYRLEMSTKLSCPDGSPNLYKFWDDALTASIAEEKPAWILNVASQEYAKSVDLKALAAPPHTIPVITASFPGPAVHAKMARGEMVRFCAQNTVTAPEALRAFRGSNGAWRYVPEASDETTYVFHRSAAGTAKKASGGGSSSRDGGGKKRGNEGEDASVAKPASRRRK